MMKKRLLLGVAAAGLIAVGLLGGVVLAQEGKEADTDDAGSQTIFERVADILDVDGVDADALEDAFKQAKHDMETDRVGDFLDGLVEKEVVDRETADSYLEWYGDRPMDLYKTPELLPYGAWKHDFGKWQLSLGKWQFSSKHDVEKRLEQIFKKLDREAPKFWHSGKQFRFYFPKKGSED